MSDDHTRPALDYPPLPEPKFIPKAIIDKWAAIDPDKYLALKLTRTDLDLLFATINQSIMAQEHFRQAMISWTAGDLASANNQSHLAAHKTVEAQNALRSLFTAIMAGAEPQD
ncbi:hypothetical protein G5B40_05555 [Pikeienuella piscinae]|uniref:Uncharacterized protein n=1 Tax=Pikeienuella piscinae TaxID=2748098 RepID=A0A7L5BV69_9RHOB|nr:hypothetical protein [Pikeienuella piscinae]QIE54963.1 hypothetical protein G5B40_05555 [Pikeienuella piscinae]